MYYVRPNEHDDNMLYLEDIPDYQPEYHGRSGGVLFPEHGNNYLAQVCSKEFSYDPHYTN